MAHKATTPRAAAERPAFSRDERGAVFAEYAVVMVAVTLVAAFAVAALSVPLFNLYAFAETLIGLPVP